MNLKKLFGSFMFLAALTSATLFAHEHDTHRAYGKLSASPTVSSLSITTPQGSVPALTGWQPLPVDTFSNSFRTSCENPNTAAITVKNKGTYLVNALVTLAYPTPGSNGPEDLTNYCIGIMCNGELQQDSIGSMHISTEGGHENPGLLFSCSLSDIVKLSEDSSIQFVISASTGAESPAIMEVVSVNATITQIGH